MLKDENHKSYKRASIKAYLSLQGLSPKLQIKHYKSTMTMTGKNKIHAPSFSLSQFVYFLSAELSMFTFTKYFYKILSFVKVNIDGSVLKKYVTKTKDSAPK